MTISSVSSHYPVSKSLGSHPAQSQKALSYGETSHTELDGWVLENTKLYEQIVSGKSELSQADQAQFMEWWNWATSESQSSSFGEDIDMDLVEGEGANGDFGQGADPYGGKVGANGNLVYTDDEARIEFIGEERPMDVWARNFTFDVPANSVNVTMEETMDTRMSPPEKVWRLTAMDKATGKTSVVYIHGVDETPPPMVKINTSGKRHVTDYTGKATIGDYKKIDPNAAPESNVTPELIDDKYVVEAPIGQTVELTPAGGEDQVWEVYGNYNISCRPSDKVVVTKTGDDTYTIEVQHRDGSKDTYMIQAGSEGNINATPANVTFNERTGTKNVHGVEVVDLEDLEVSDGRTPATPDEPKEVKVPDGWENLTLNGGASDESLEELNGDQPTSVEDGVRIYDGQDFNVSPVQAGEDKETKIDASGAVTITPNSNSEYFTLTVENGQFVLKVYSDSARTELKETIKIDAALIDTLNLNIDSSRLEMGQIPAEYKKKVKSTGQEDVASGEALPSREEILANLPAYIVNDINMQDFVSRFDAAVQSGDPADWQKVIDKLSDYDNHYGNDAVRSLITALYKSVGGDYVKLKDMLKLIPAEVRQKMVSEFSDIDEGFWGTDQEWDERHEGEIWDSEDTQALIKSTLE